MKTLAHEHDRRVGRALPAVPEALHHLLYRGLGRPAPLSIEARAFFAERNVTVRALLTDNGSAYRSHKFRSACEQMQLKHRRTRPYTPRTNGKAERFIQTTLKEWAYAEHWSS